MKFPESIQAIAYEFSIAGQRTTPLRQPEPVGPRFPLPDPCQTKPPNLCFQNTLNPFNGILSHRTFTLQIPMMPHGPERRTLPPFYLTFRSWEEARSFSVPISLRTLEPPDLQEFALSVRVEVADDQSE